MADFEYFNIMDVDPNFSPLDEGVYKLRVNKMTLKSTIAKSGKHEGEQITFVNGDYTVVENDKFSGRRLFHTFWLTNGFDLKALRRIADRTGVVQQPGQSFEDWLKALTEMQPEFKVKVDVVPEIDRVTRQPKVDEVTGKPVMTNAIDFKNVLTAN